MDGFLLAGCVAADRPMSPFISDDSDVPAAADADAVAPELKKTRKKKLPDLEPSSEEPTAPSKRLKDSSQEWPTVSKNHDQLPLELVLVRHGQSEGNEAVKRSKGGDLSAYTPEFRQKHSSGYRLTDKGIAQAKCAGKWIKENMSTHFDRYYTSEYVRAMETAALLDLPDAQWLTEMVLRERDKGHLDNVSWVERHEKYADEMARRKRDSFFWAPPGGESMAQILGRIDHTFNTLRRECSNQRVIIVCHGEIMWAFRIRIERLSQMKYHKLQTSKDRSDAIRNTTILHYSRVHPKTGEVFSNFRFMRMICPWKPEKSKEGWQEFERPKYSNDELLQSVGLVPRFVNNVPEEKPEDDPDF